MENKIIKLALLVTASGMVIKALKMIKEQNSEEEVQIIEADCVERD